MNWIGLWDVNDSSAPLAEMMQFALDVADLLLLAMYLTLMVTFLPFEPMLLVPQDSAFNRLRFGGADGFRLGAGFGAGHERPRRRGADHRETDRGGH
jgi:hypothetical protein